MIRILLAREMEAILFLARWHTFFTGARAINAVARVSFRVVTRRGTAGRRVQFLSWRNGRRFNENTGGRISMGKKTFDQEQFHRHLVNIYTIATERMG